jgi:hypothetical protein
MNYPIDQLTEANRLTGFALWEVLNSHIDSCCAGIDNQPGSKAYDPEAPQGVGMTWEYKHDPNLPCNWYPYALECTIDPTVPIQEHILTLTVSTTAPEIDLLIEQEFALSVSQLIALLPFLKADRFSEVRGLLVAEDHAEYILSGLQKDLGMPRSLRPDPDN